MGKKEISELRTIPVRCGLFLFLFLSFFSIKEGSDTWAGNVKCVRDVRCGDPVGNFGMSEKRTRMERATKLCGTVLAP